MKIKNKQQWVILIIALMIPGLLLAGCGNGEGTEEVVEPESAEEQEVVVEEEESNGDHVVIDHMGREVQIPDEINRPVALTANLMEGLYIIGLEPVATVDNYRIRSEAEELPKLGVQGNVNIEAIYGVEPDFIVAHFRHQGELVESLEEIGVPLFVIDPAQVGDAPLYDSALYLGKILNREEAALEFVEEVEAIAEGLKEEIREKTEIRTGLILEDGDSIRAAQTASGIGAILTGLGIENIVPEDMPGAGNETFVSFDIETIASADPDVILIRPSSNDKDHNKQRLESYQSDPMWAELSAVKNNNIHMLPFRLHPGRATVDEMYKMAANVILSED
ncbi:ABC transporter substrate-binding protein [Tindallia californiensis]|uniref:ABC transporter substrate-binding protein n=1 Tax=Tindallia californiensis TaxID=159292 RepID=UPI001A9A3AE5|nr:ABC transporter substrate-binding protein [Tindallia californiensis]